MPKQYTTITGDQWDIVALKTLGNELYKTDIMKANLKYRGIVIFPAGITLAIPEVETEIFSESLPPWKRGRA